MPSIAAENGNKLLWQGGRQWEDYDAEENVRDAELISDCRRGMRQHVSSKANRQETQKQKGNVVAELVSFAL